MKRTVTKSLPSGADGGFRGVLQAELARRCAKNPRYSLRSFAEQLKIDHATLSQLLRGRRAITPRTIDLLGRRLKLSERDIETYVAYEQLVSSAHVDTDDLRQLTADAAEVVADLHHFAILELTHLRDFRPDTRWIARVLGRSVDDVNLAIQRLLRLGLLEMADQNRWIDRSGSTVAHLGEFAHIVIRRLSEQARKLSLRSLKQVPASYRVHTSTTMAIATRDLPKATEHIARFRRQLEKLLSNDRSNCADDVYHLRVELFPITAIQRKEARHGPARHAVSDSVKKP
ncbi:hypothetical protein BH09PLA1_BH09PLA1_14350 [soil metagenome]